MDYRGIGNGAECLQEHSPRILIIDDHPLSCKGYKLIIQLGIQKGILPYFNIEIANSLETAYGLLMENHIFYDMVFLDICMEPFPEQNFFSGEDLGNWMLEKHPKTKILVMTSLTDKFRLGTILEKLKPQGFLIKCEVDENHLIKAIQKVNDNLSYYTPSIIKMLEEESIINVLLGDDEKEFLYLLSKGFRNKEISEVLPWSLSKLEKRKRAIHKKLGVEKGTTMALVAKAKELGII